MYRVDGSPRNSMSLIDSPITANYLFCCFCFLSDWHSFCFILWQHKEKSLFAHRGNSTIVLSQFFKVSTRVVIVFWLLILCFHILKEAFLQILLRLFWSGKTIDALAWETWCTLFWYESCLLVTYALMLHLYTSMKFNFLLICKFWICLLIWVHVPGQKKKKKNKSSGLLSHGDWSVKTMFSIFSFSKSECQSWFLCSPLLFHLKQVVITVTMTTKVS